MVLLLFYAFVFTVENVMNLPVHFKRQYDGIVVKANEKRRDLHTLLPSVFDDVFLLIKLFPSYHFTDYKVFIVSVKEKTASSTEELGGVSHLTADSGGELVESLSKPVE
ncbi:putative RNA helicase SDE3 [Gossypium australe]|uniref:Putative RNA helicase SDE3 n=1 Tax=Gossypium australe TaxID=47621 RepID=A0A5B6UB79_9ROSI|nr:putative RNA helicase SDE3 [Gossypium australe]